MSINCFVDLLIVKTGEQIKFAQFDHDKIYEDDVVELENGELGIVLFISFQDPACAEYQRIATYAPIHSVKNHYRRTACRKEYENAPF